MAVINRKLSIAFVVLAAVLVSFSVYSSDNSDSADTTYVRNISIEIYDQTSADYSRLVYLSDKLPASLNATEWNRDAASGLWYNVNTNSSDVGKILRYGMVTGITVDEIRTDILAAYSSVFTGTDFIITQVGYDIYGECGVNIEIKKDGTSVLSKDVTASKDVAGRYIANSVEAAYQYTLNASGDIPVAAPAGFYTLTIKCNGITAGSATTGYLGTVYNLYGNVEDKGGKPIPNATIAYEITDSDGNVMSSGSLLTDQYGEYILRSVGGTIVNIKSVSAAGFTFKTTTYSYGTITGDAYPGMTFVSNENYIRVLVKDQSARPAENVEIRAEWYRSVDNGDGTYTYERKTDGVSIPSATDANGVALVTLSQVFSEYNLYIKGMSGQYSFTDVDNRINPSTTRTEPLPEYLNGAGNAYANVVSFPDVGIKADDFSITVTVKGSVDTSFQGGAALEGVHVVADWYYQVYDGSIYTIRDKDHRTYADDLYPGRVWFSNAYTGADGIVLLHYTKPESMATGEEAFLYVYAKDAPASSPSGDYTFNYGLPADGEKSISEIANGYVTCVAMAMASIVNTEVNSDDVSYTLGGTITGDVPDEVTVYCINPQGIEMNKTVAKSGSTITFSFTVKAGASVKIGINDLPGYSFTPQSQQMPSAYSDSTAFSAVAAQSAWTIERNAPVVLKTYDLTGATAGSILNLRYSVAGTTTVMQVRAASSAVSIPIYGLTGTVVENFTLTGENLYVKWTDDTHETIASMISISVVTYYDKTADQPTIDNVAGGQNIQVFIEGQQYAVIVTDASGKATTSVPNFPTLAFKLGGLAVDYATISSGAYEGCLGLNLKEVIDYPGPTYVTVTIRYIATSSLQNQAVPTNVDILSGPTTVTLTVGETQTCQAPEVEGFTFSGWYINGVSKSDSRDLHICSFPVTKDMDGATLLASYAPITPEPPKEDIGPTIAMVAMAVIIALVALVYVLVQTRRY
ncbi:MAG: hypothetical protein J5945_02800 [Candidatus Methanomethylophilus sp.]|nr:hypothetical protein [Methanomethylophilus sp.]